MTHYHDHDCDCGCGHEHDHFHEEDFSNQDKYTKPWLCMIQN